MSLNQQIADYIVTRHAPDLRGEPIPGGYDLVANGVVDSLALLELVEWVQHTWSIPVLDTAITASDFSSIDAITKFVRTHAPAPVAG